MRCGGFGRRAEDRGDRSVLNRRTKNKTPKRKGVSIFRSTDLSSSPISTNLVENLLEGLLIAEVADLGEALHARHDGTPGRGATLFGLWLNKKKTSSKGLLFSSGW